MEENKSQVKSEKMSRKGLHKYFHISQMGTYLCVSGGLVFIIISIIVVTNVFGFGSEKFSYISWIDTLQIGLLFVITGVVLRMYYHFFEERYEK